MSDGSRELMAAQATMAEFIDGEGNVRVGPGTNHRVLIIPEKGTIATVLGRQGQWVNIRFHGNQEGWVHQINLKMIAAKPELSMAEFTDSEGNVRVGPGTNHKVLIVPEKGTRVTVLDKNGKWRQIRFANGMTGWCHQLNLKTAKNTSGEGAFPENGTTYSPLKIDLNNDGQAEMVYLQRHKMFNNDPDDAEYHLKVIQPGPQGRAIWEDTSQKTTFYVGHTGVEELQAVGDIDSDGIIELISPRAQSDVQPVIYRVFSWQDNRFVESKGGYLYAPAKNPKEFFWSQAGLSDFTGVCWISHFLEFLAPGKVKASVVSYTKDGAQFGEGIFTGTAKGFILDSWVSPLKSY